MEEMSDEQRIREHRERTHRERWLESDKAKGPYTGRRISEEVQKAARTSNEIQTESGIHVMNHGRPPNGDVVILTVEIPGRRLRDRSITREEQETLELLVVDWIQAGLANHQPPRGMDLVRGFQRED